MNVLFVCVGNAGRSQMAHSFYEARGGSARSAGTQPATDIDPHIVDVLEEVDLDVGGRTPHKLDRADVEWADLVVTMGCGDRCPLLPGKEYLDWNLADPVGLCLDEVRELRNDIERRVAQLPL